MSQNVVLTPIEFCGGNMAPILSDPSTQSSQEIFKLTLELYSLISRSKCANIVLRCQDELVDVLEVDQNIAGP